MKTLGEQITIMADKYCQKFKVDCKVYTYHVDLDERGFFLSHVESPDGKIIYTLSNEAVNNDDRYHDYGSIWEVDAGYMRHVRDMSGLTDYLREMKIIGPDDTVVLA